MCGCEGSDPTPCYYVFWIETEVLNGNGMNGPFMCGPVLRVFPRVSTFCTLFCDSRCFSRYLTDFSILLLFISLDFAKLFNNPITFLYYVFPR